METVNQFIPFLGTSLALFIFIWCMHWLLIARHNDLGNERKFPRQLIMMGLTIVSVIIIALVLPVNESSRNQLIGLIGLLVSGLFAFSSTTVVANLMAGMLIRVTNPFEQVILLELAITLVVLQKKVFSILKFSQRRVSSSQYRTHT